MVSKDEDSNDGNLAIIIATTAPSPLPFELPPSLQNPTTPYTKTLLHLFKPQNPTTTTTTAANWAHLPTNILFGLFKYLDTTTDIPHLRAVCTSWRSSLPLSLLPNPISTTFQNLPELPLLPHHQPLFLRASDYFLLSPPNNTNDHDHDHDQTPAPWLVKMTQFAKQRCRLFNPCNMDPYFTPTPPLIGTINIADLKAIHLSSPLYLVTGGDNLSPFDFKSGVILSKKIVGGWNLRCGFGIDYNPFCVLVMLKDKFGGGLLFKRWGDQVWLNIIDNEIDDSCESLGVADITFYKGDFYVFEELTWQVGVINPRDCAVGESPWMEFMEAPELLDVDGDSSFVEEIYFVPGRDSLFLVFEVREDDNKSKLMVFRLDEQEGEWVRVWNIGNEVFFIGSDVSFAVCTEHLPPRWKAGTIWFFDRRGNPLIDMHVKALLGDEMPKGIECMDAVSYVKYWMLLEMFDMDDEEKGVVPLGEVVDKEAYSGLFFPPPAWVKWHCPSLGDVEVKLHNLKFTDSYESGNNVGGYGADMLEEVP